VETKLLSDHAEDLLKAAELLRNGAVVGMPTETVYGLAADARNPEAVRQIFAAKGRPADNPLIVHIAEMRALEQVAATVPSLAEKLAERFWGGPGGAGEKNRGGGFWPGPSDHDSPKAERDTGDHFRRAGYGGHSYALSPGGTGIDPAVRCTDRSSFCQYFRLSQPDNGTACHAGYAGQNCRSCGRRSMFRGR